MKFSGMRFNKLRHVLIVTGVMCAISLNGADRPELDGIEYESARDITDAEARLLAALREPMVGGMDVSEALNLWFDGRKASRAGEADSAARLWQQGTEKLAAVTPLAQAEWARNPDGDLEFVSKFDYPDMDGTAAWVVRWKVDNLLQYGVLIAPVAVENKEANEQYPLLLYLHGAAFGVPAYALPWLARMARAGYVIIGPALRGEDLFAFYYSSAALPSYKCEGSIENLDGEVNDALSAVAGTRKLPYVRNGKYGIIGHSFGSGVGLLAAARDAENVACIVSYDAWLTNPFRYYWDRMRRGANNWLSWAAYCNQPVDQQLKGLMKRSIVHHAEQLSSPLLMFIGGAYAGSVFHKSHDDLIVQLKRFEKPYEYHVVPEGGHNFVLYYSSAAARFAYAKHMKFLEKHLAPPAVDNAAPAAINEDRD